MYFHCYLIYVQYSAAKQIAPISSAKIFDLKFDSIIIIKIYYCYFDIYKRCSIFWSIRFFSSP